jgi:N-acetylglutamate synthase-like GNAT family acetyltransferase
VKIIEPTTPEEFKKYYDLRYEMLRKPWGQPPGSERDKEEETSIHRMIIDNKTVNVLAVGRLQFNSTHEAQIRYMAVSDDFQGKGLGSQIVSALEDVAREKGIQRIILSARENALQFYKNNGYEIVKKTHLLFGKIQHWLMKKELNDKIHNLLTL